MRAAIARIPRRQVQVVHVAPAWTAP